MRTSILVLLLLLNVGVAQREMNTGIARADPNPPTRFPHRIWAACDFEGPMQAYHWFGPRSESDVPKYPGNKAVMGVAEKPYKNVSAVMTGINPVPGPRMGTENGLYLRYRLQGTNSATFQYFSLSSEDNNRVRVTGLSNRQWAELTVNFSRDAQRNDGTPGVPFKRGERMDDLKVLAGRADSGKEIDLLVDDIILYANEPDRAPEIEPFPNRVIWLAAFDTGISPQAKPKYWPGRYDVVQADSAPQDSWWGVARAVLQRNGGQRKLVALPIHPPRQVGTHTKLRFRYHLGGASDMTVQIFDATVQDNRHVNLSGLAQDQWQTRYVDITKDSIRNDGTKDGPLIAGNLVDELFFFVDREAELHVDEVVLFDARQPYRGEAD